MISVTISQFDDPLDLLLALVRRNQYPLDALPIAEITRQYLTYMKKAREADVELGGDFLETASWLVLLKSRALLPQAPGEVAPAHELERALVDHETMLRTAGLLRGRIDAAGVGPGGAGGRTRLGDNGRHRGRFADRAGCADCRAPGARRSQGARAGFTGTRDRELSSREDSGPACPAAGSARAGLRGLDGKVVCGTAGA